MKPCRTSALRAAAFVALGALCAPLAQGGQAKRFTARPAAANVVDFPPQSARYVRFAIQVSFRGQPCIDELEVYGPKGGPNLALAARGAKAAASSCLPGYPIHQIPHLNDGRYGNSHSWISAGERDEWAQIELAQPAEVARIVFSRDREGRYTDRVPVRFQVQLSLDGKAWTTVRTVVATVAGQPTSRAVAARPHVPLPASATPEDLVRFAFLCERAAWQGAVPKAPPDQAGYWLELAEADAVSRSLRQMADLARRLERKGLDVAHERAALAELRRRYAALDKGEDADPAPETELYLAARLAKRRLFFRDPQLAPLRRILFVKRHPFLPSHNYSVLLDGRFRPGGGICVLDIPKAAGRLEPERAALTRLFDASKGMARTPMADFDARRVYFSFRPAADDYFRILAMDADGTNVRELTSGRPFHDFWPCPLPDGGVAFLSTRCACRYLCWRPQAFVLFRMEADGSRPLALSWANLSEWSPSVMRDGRLLWTRSEYQDKGADFGHTLWAIRPDGAHPELIFGNNTIHAYMNGRQVPGSNEFVATLACHAGDLNGPLALIDPARGRSSPEAVTVLTPDVRPPIGMDGRWPRTGCFRDAVAVSRDVFLCSHSPQDAFGLYLVDRYGNRELLYLDPALGSMCPTLLRPVPRPTVVSNTFDGKATGQFFVQDVYEGLGPGVERGRARYIRVCQEVRSDLARLPTGDYRSDHRPFQDFYASPIHKVRGPHGWPSYVAKGVHGVAPVEADGSASFRAPAGKVLYFQLLDADFNEIQRMRSVMQLQPGEKRGCIGCHESRSSAPPQRPLAMALAREPSELEPPPWGTGPFSYQKVVQPVWDRHCIRCHNAKHARKLDLTGVLDAERIPASYRTVVSQGWVHYFNWVYGQRHGRAAPLSFGTLRSKLWKVLDAGHNRVSLSPEDRRRIKCWTDLNCPLWPDYQQRQHRPATREVAEAGH